MPRGGRNGSQPVYTEELAEEILERIADGESLSEICREAHMPTHWAVLLWVSEDRPPGFAHQYARAREAGCYKMAEEIIAISDADYMGPDGFVDNAAIQQARLKSDNRKWALSKMLPKTYGDKVTQELVGNPDQPIVNRIELVPVDPIVRAIPSRTRIEDSRDDENI
jgi:hypothetical protein